MKTGNKCCFPAVVPHGCMSCAWLPSSGCRLQPRHAHVAAGKACCGDGARQKGGGRLGAPRRGRRGVHSPAATPDALRGSYTTRLLLLLRTSRPLRPVISATWQGGKKGSRRCMRGAGMHVAVAC